MKTIYSDIFKPSVLVVDDAASILKILRRFLSFNGFETVNTALTAEQGLKIIENANRPFSIILSDQHMPGMNGYAFFERVMEISPESRRILMTGFRDFQSALEAINRGGIHKYITKPWDDADLLKVLSQESAIYRSIREKKRLHTITRNQNTRFYRLAKQMAVKKKGFKKQIELRKEQLASCKIIFNQLKKQSATRDIPAGLDEFFLHKEIKDQTCLVRACEIINSDIGSMLASIAKKYDLTLPGGSSAPAAVKKDRAGILSPDYDLIDLVIGYAVQNTMSLLEKIHPSFASDHSIDNYNRVPDIAELACANGLIQLEDLYRLKKENTGNTSGQLSKSAKIGEMLILSGRLSRVELSRLVVKRQFIKDRLSDRKKSKQLVIENIISAETLETCFSEQSKRFEMYGECVPIGDILFEKKMIGQQTLDDCFNAGQKTKTVLKHTDPQQETSAVQKKLPFELIVSEDGTSASVKNTALLPDDVHIDQVKRLLKNNGVVSGVVPDSHIKDRITTLKAVEDEWVVAEAVGGIRPKNGTIEYYFNTEYQSPGIFKDDGTIDFRERGDIPFVKNGDILAKKIPCEKGTPGTNIFGEPVTYEPMEDPVLKAGDGTRLSDDELVLYATIEGEPCLDNNGMVSVFKELVIKKDVDFETGHINFNGNVIVHGTIKEGFKVDCVTLTVTEINGGMISTTGDLNVSRGIINARVSTGGDIRAKFVNKSTIDALGNMTITREIMESEIAVNGECVNKDGRITSSTISAKMGLYLNRVGTPKADISILKPGVNDYLIRQKAHLLQKKETTKTRLNKLTKTCKVLEEKNFKCHQQISEYSFACERLKKDSKSADKKTKALSRIDALEKQIKQLFDSQDDICVQIDTNQDHLNEAKDALKVICANIDQTDHLIVNQPGVPVIKVLRHVEAGTRIVGTNASMTFRQDSGACKILEIDTGYADSPAGKEMVIQSF